jgi:YVTN family beta-propeller protein
MDATTRTVTKTITLTAGTMPRYMYCSDDTLYVTCTGTNQVAVINIATDTLTGYINVGSTPYFMAGNAITDKLLICNWDSNTVSIIDMNTNTVTATVGVGTNPAGVTILNTGAKAYVANFGNNNVSVIDLSTNTVSASVVVGSSPVGIGLEPNNQRAYVTNTNSNNISIIDTSTNAVSGSINSTYSNPEYLAIFKVSHEGPDSAPMQVTFNVNKGGIVNIYNANVSIYDAYTGVFISSDPTDAAGNSIFWLIPGKRYTVDIIDAGISFNQSVQVQPNDQYYYIDVCTNEILGSYQYSILYKLHACTLYVYNFGSPEKYASVQLYKNGTLIKNSTTDETGGAAYNVQSDVLYTIRVYNTTKSIDKNFTEYLNTDARTLDLWIISIPGWTYNDSTLNPDGPHNIYINGSVAARTNGGNYFIDCWYNDTGALTTSVNYTLYVSQNGALTQLDTHTHSGTISADTHSFQVTAPTGKDYTVKIEGVQAGGNTTMWYHYHWPGAMVPIPGLPNDWYKYVSLLIIGGVALGTATRLNVGLVAATMTIATLFINNVLGWMFEITAAPILIFFMIIISVVMVMTQKNKGEI